VTQRETQHAAHGRVGGKQDEEMCLLRRGWLVEMEPDDQPLNCRARAGLGVRNLAWKLEASSVAL